MTEKTLPFGGEELESICRDYPTPFHIYDEKAIRENARRFRKAFDWVPGGFKNSWQRRWACPGKTSCSPPTTPLPKSSKRQES